MKSLLFALPLCLLAHDCSVELEAPFPLFLECTGKHRILYNGGHSKTEIRYSKKATLEARNSTLFWGDEINPYEAFTLMPLKNCRILVNGTEYPGSLHCAYDKKVINYVDVDILVQTLMQKADLNTYSLETLKALATALRTDLCSETRVIPAAELDYQGSALLYQYPKIAQAIVETKNQVMTFEEKVFPTTYCKDAAGVTASFSSIFRQPSETPIGITLPVNTSHTWKKSFSKQELFKRLKVDTLKNLSFYSDKKSDKIYAVKVEDTSGPRVFLIERFIELLELDSNHFQLKTSADNFSFEGQGDGLGVGLCLKTAETLAQKGFDAAYILKVCYPDIKISILDK